ncbi:4-hydroxy-tetrahydrodipicolinate reductase [Candidatus Liberibacter americanus]|uniref:4-hydroxy-tetrahydrodipicolinate reductase n=1 Tax=Candidatus Liberibacter americanus str. Sao Paulo TaxID=1261131 RepID=U6B581_9HYPH|nr:4-hydroxy-tetrahydrodipicolinate reductase [Candidatus Liberibacter americanus]AHA28204.1 Dihydrodipicolinate reductase [Candidatus Liberibacter americanus str. Sao Paulo]EMS36282.1 dihydrodipicolinate reductase [Candidatus Liberibacter americanus PW_SP]
MQKSPMRIAILGGGGRMGKALVKAIHENSSVNLQSIIVRAGSPLLGKDAGVVAGMPFIGVQFTDDIKKALHSVDGVIDFSSPAFTLEALKISSDMHIVHIIGTTGFSDNDNNIINDFSRNAKIVKSGNMSLGINFLGALAKISARYFPGNKWDFEILEMHHRHKLDAPSGTALFLGDAISSGRNVDLSKNYVLDRNKKHQLRKEGSIGFATLRGGSVVGDHSIIIAGEGESITLSHSAYDRSIFANGAITAALWALSKDNGLYSMLDVLDMELFDKE